MRNNAQMAFARMAWLVTVLVALITALLLALSGYTGYAGLGIAVAASAAINLPRQAPPGEATPAAPAQRDPGD